MRQPGRRFGYFLVILAASSAASVPPPASKTSCGGWASQSEAGCLTRRPVNSCKPLSGSFVLIEGEQDLALEHEDKMRIDPHHAAKLAVVVGVAMLIMPTLGFRAEGSLKRAPYVAGSVELDVVRDAGENAGRTVPAGSVAHRGTPWAPHEAKPRRMESDSPVAGGSHRRPVTVTAGSAHLTLSSIGDELKATITLLQAFSCWIRLSPEPASNSLG